MIKNNKYGVVCCYNCGTPFYIKYPQKTKKCPTCNKILKISKLLILFETTNVNEALIKVLELKKPKNNVGFFNAFKAYSEKV